MRKVRHQQRDCLNLTLPDGRSIELLRVRDPRARNLRLLLSSRGPRLTVPPGVPVAQEQTFLHQHLPDAAGHLGRYIGFLGLHLALQHNGRRCRGTPQAIADSACHGQQGQGQHGLAESGCLHGELSGMRGSAQAHVGALRVLVELFGHAGTVQQA